jgi:hypothetical protein
LITSQVLDGSGEHPRLLHLIGVNRESERDADRCFVVPMPESYEVRGSFLTPPTVVAIDKHYGEGMSNNSPWTNGLVCSRQAN